LRVQGVVLDSEFMIWSVQVASLAIGVEGWMFRVEGWESRVWGFRI